MSLTVRKLSLDAGGSNVRIELSGRLDSNTAGELETMLKPLLAGNVRNMVFNLADLDFISSAGIRVLMTTRMKLAERNGTVLLTNLQPQIAKVMEILKALPGLSIFASAEELDEYLAAMQQKVIDEQQN